ncbi:acetoacetate decarboxylase family protein [Lyngbya sp. CCAP 1446/10]|uniref:acetoacetate decarboxylase family protein n=1 Tax=Lyngbya sp. CCAP 1446/10 TaxID=439293 RepID=UPI002237299C|nr:acetoacetate decarboxylase family protein [Lyngbya sp. CCAP 1446/10]MCW6053350.1 acetoacetate decarboxylase family protein [Lyngbya sp. CCAP 1446/10]
MVYPPAPWNLQGYAVQTLQLIDVARVRPLVPSELEIVSVLPGKTLGGVYISSYGLGSVMEYNELIVVSAIANYAGKWGAWISHIYVDNPNSVAGGREIWGLPKELAQFSWEGNDSVKATPLGYRVTVSQANRQLCSLNYSKQSLALPVSFSGNVFSALSSNLLLFKGEFNSRIGLLRGELEIPEDSHFANLNLSQPLLTVGCEDMRLIAGAPEVVGNRAAQFSY